MPIEQSRDPKQFSAFELSGWDTNIHGYNSAFGAVTRQTVGPMLDAADVKHGKRVLDICCGPGMLAAGALERDAEVIGLDFAAEAVELARKLIPNGHFQQGDAQALPFPAASFDAVLCGYGLMHLPEPAAALREILRVLRPDGRAALSVWDLTGAGFTLVYEAVRARGSLIWPCRTDPIFSSLDRRSVCGRGWKRRASPTPRHIPSARTGTWPTQTVTSNPFLAAPSARAPYSPPNRVLRRLAYDLISPTI